MRASPDPESRKVSGYAAVFNKDSEDFGWFVERIHPDAFNEADMSDVRALINHDPNLILARTPDTLALSVDNTGLKYEFDVPETTRGNDFLEELRLGLITQSSFGFTVKGQEWIEEKGEVPVRVITKIDRLFDVSPVTYPAYPDTTVAKRSLDQKREKQTPSANDEIMARLRLNQITLLNQKIPV